MYMYDCTCILTLLGVFLTECMVHVCPASPRTVHRSVHSYHRLHPACTADEGEEREGRREGEREKQGVRRVG